MGVALQILSIHLFSLLPYLYSWQLSLATGCSASEGFHKKKEIILVTMSGSSFSLISDLSYWFDKCHFFFLEGEEVTVSLNVQFRIHVDRIVLFPLKDISVKVLNLQHGTLGNSLSILIGFSQLVRDQIHQWCSKRHRYNSTKAINVPSDHRDLCYQKSKLHG